MATKGKSKKSPVTKTEKQSPYSPSEIKKFIGEVQVEFSKIVRYILLHLKNILLCL